MSEIPVHCVIDALGDGCCLKCTLQGETTSDKKRLLDSYAIVAGCTPLSKLNDVVLSALGFPQFASSPIQGDLAKSKGSILIDNWKPLAFEQITDDLETPIEHLFKHIGANRWSLNILVLPKKAKSLNENASVIRMVEDARKAPVPEQEPESEPDPDQDPSPRPSSDPAIGTNWYQLFPRYHPYLPTISAYPSRMDTVSPPNLTAFMANRLFLTNAEITAAAALAGHQSQIQLPQKMVMPTVCEDDKSAIDTQNRAESGKSRSPKYTSIVPPRKSVLVAPKSTTGTRQGIPATCRLMFDPLTELPMLNEWFEHNSHPTCHDIEKYTDLLNSKAYRRTYPPVSTHNVKIWFKNRRAKCKRVV